MHQLVLPLGQPSSEQRSYDHHFPDEMPEAQRGRCAGPGLRSGWVSGPGYHLLPVSGAPGPGFEVLLVPLRSGASHLCHPKSRDITTVPTTQEFLIFYGLSYTVKPPRSVPGPRGLPPGWRPRRGWQSVRRGLETPVRSAVSAENRSHSGLSALRRAAGPGLALSPGQGVGGTWRLGCGC